MTAISYLNRVPVIKFSCPLLVATNSSILWNTVLSENDSPTAHWVVSSRIDRLEPAGDQHYKLCISLVLRIFRKPWEWEYTNFDRAYTSFTTYYLKAFYYVSYHWNPSKIDASVSYLSPTFTATDTRYQEFF